MNGVDLFLIIIFLLSVWSGYKQGFIAGIISLFIWVGSLVIALFFYQYVSEWLLRIFPNLQAWSMPLAFIIVLLISRALLSLISDRLLRYIPKESHQTQINKLGGVIPGAINGLVWTTILSALLLAIPLSDGITKEVRESKIANRLSAYVEWLNEKFAPVFDEAVAKTINKVTVDPESVKSVRLPYTVSNPDPRPDLEAQMLDMVNEERRKQGLDPLQADEESRTVARKHSMDMFNRGYFSHITPEGQTPGNRMRKEGVRFITSGENLALGQTLLICHNGLMNSPGHRANILNPAYGHVGIGILDGGKYGLMITQNFRN